MNPEALAKQKKLKSIEQANAKAVLVDIRQGIESLGFLRSRTSRGRYEITIGQCQCVLGISKLSLSPRLRITGSIVGDSAAGFLVSDEFTYKGHPSGFRFSLDVSRFKDNSVECAEQVVSFVRLVALPWFHTAIGRAQQKV